MYLKRLELIGFKSFFDKTIVDLKSGMTAIVGPNGCGKSNLIDAILWVLGEQRPKALRGDKMEDVIFNGTEHRKPLGMAEVSLTLGDISEPTSSPYSPYSEITITRRLFRSGESEYSINQVACRLKDVRELLIDFRAGYKIHTIIEQGRVDELLSASPVQRRELVEEAANVTKYRLRKEEAVRKLDATERNLVRIQDISAEVKRQINALDRQARQARKYSQIYEDLKSHELAIASTEWKEWTQTGETLLHEDALLRETLVAHETQEGACSLQIAATRLSLTEREQEISRHKDQIAERDGRIGKAEGRVERTRAQKKEWTETEERTKVELSEIAKAEEAIVLERSLLGEERQETERTLPEMETQFLKQAEAVKQIEEALAQRSGDEEKKRADVYECASRLTEARNNLVHFDARKETLAKKREADALRSNEIEQRRGITQERLEKLQAESTGIEHQIIEKREALSQALVDLKTIGSKQEEDKNSLYKMKEVWARTLAELASKEGFYRGLLSPTGATTLNLQSPFRFIADILDVPADYEKAIEAALGDKLRGMVVEEMADLKKGIKQLQALKSGRGTFILRDGLGRLSQQEKAGNAPDISGVIGTALRLISWKTEYETVVMRLLGGVIVVRDMESVFEWLTSASASASASSLELPRLFVSLQGEVIDPAGIISAGEGGHLFEQKRGVASLSEETERLHAEVAQLEIKIGQNKVLQQAIQLQTEQWEGVVREEELKRQTLQKEIHALTLENDKIHLTHQTFLLEQASESQERDTLSQKREKELLVIAALEQQKDERERLFSLSMQEREAVLSEKKGVEEELVSLQLQLASLKEKQKRVLEKIDQVVRSEAVLKKRSEDQTKLLTLLAEKSVLAQAEESESLLEIEGLAVSRRTILETVRQIAEDHAATLAILEALTSESEKIVLEKNKIVGALNDISVRRVEAQMTLNKVRETIFAQYQIEMMTTNISLPAVIETRDTEPASIEERRQKRDQLRVSLVAIGPVSLGAIEEYEALSKRYEFLKSQEEDLIKSTEDLKTAIAKINKTTEGLFIETFHALNQKFSETFTSFFGGGKGELVLVDPGNPLESGIEIIAAPPGKKPKSLSLFSGGEKALTALSLLFATFLNQPAPFCVLDEVDAPLDDENTRRFSAAIERLSGQTQFMVITHNKRTMEKADILYGVTAEEAGVSKLISVSLKDIGHKQIAPQPAPIA